MVSCIKVGVVMVSLQRSRTLTKTYSNFQTSDFPREEEEKGSTSWYFPVPGVYFLKPGLISSHQDATEQTGEDMIERLWCRGQNSQDILGYYSLWGQPGHCEILPQNAKRRHVLVVSISRVQLSRVEHVQGVVSRFPRTH